MVNIKDNFNFSYFILKDKKKLVIPFFLSSLTFYLFITSFISLSGFYTPLKDLNQINIEYKDYVNSKVYSGDNLIVEFKDYIKDKFNYSDYYYLLSFKTLVLFLTLLVWLIISTSLINIGYYQNSQILLGNLDISNSISNSFDFYFKLILLRILYPIFLFLPIFLIGGISFLAIKFSYILYIFLFLFTLIFMFFWMIYISLKYLFVESIMYLEGGNKNSKLFDSGISDFLIESFKITKNRLKKVFIISLIVYGISAFTNSFFGQPLIELFKNLFFNSNFISFPIILIFFFVFLVLQSFLSCFMNIFLFKSYLDFKESKNKIGDEKII